MVTKQQEYNPIPDQNYQQLLKERALKSIQKNMKRLKIQISDLEAVA